LTLKKSQNPHHKTSVVFTTKKPAVFYSKPHCFTENPLFYGNPAVLQQINIKMQSQGKFFEAFYDLGT
jgi:hypothetical protein